MQLLGSTNDDVQTALSAAQTLADRLPDTLTNAAKLIHETLLAAAIETAKRRDYSPNTSAVTMHCPLEQVALACGLSRQTLWRHLPALKELGVVDYRTHKGSLHGEVRNTGTLWQVRLSPVRGKRARLTNEELRHKWRDLEADYRRYRLSSLALKRQHETYTKTLPNIDLILTWSAPLPPATNRTPVKVVSNRLLESVLDVVSAPKDDRNKMVDLAAQALSAALGDAGSVSWYQRLLWQLLRRFDATGEDYSYPVYLAAQRALTDRTEGFARRAGALFTARLKQAPWFDEVMRTPPNRVGSKPLKP